MSASVLLEPQVDEKDRPELVMLRSLLADPGASASSLALRGDPGSGRSTLLEAAAALAPEHGLRVLRAYGVEAEAELPFSGAHQLLYPLREHITRLPQMQRDALDRAFGLTSGPSPSRFVISAAALALIEAAVTAEGALLLLIDDIAWIDRCSAEVLGFVARRLSDQPVVLLAAVSDADPALLTAGLPELVVRPRAVARSAARPVPVDRVDPMRADPMPTPAGRSGLTSVPDLAVPDLAAELAPGLTTQELRIADLAAQGLTNKQIGERLFLSHRTVGTHLYKLFPKLGITSRAALRDALEAHTRRTGAAAF